MNIRLMHEKTAPIGTISVLDIETYIEGVVAAEMDSSFKMEALKAQAIAARTYACRYINSKKNYDITDNSSKHQAYSPSRVNSTIRSAVSSTAGVVVTYNNKLATTVYSASNGGKTVSAAAKWGGSASQYPYLIAKTDPYDKRAGKKKNGHGVGMSQWGANQAAIEGLSWKSIIDFYYPGTTMKSNYNGVTSSTVNPGTSDTSSAILNKGNLIVAEARKHIGKKYVWGAQGPDTFDCSGFVWYVYKQAIGDTWSRMGAYSQYISMKNKVVWTKGSSSPWLAGDIVFINNLESDLASRNPLGITHVGIATGVGRMVVEAQGTKNGVVETDWTNRKYLYAACRRLSSSETGSGISSEDMAGIINSGDESSAYNSSHLLAGGLPLTNIDIYHDAMMGALSNIEQAGYDKGYLLDLKNGGEFKFFIPEYDHGISVNWNSQSIPGRSIEARGYSDTSAPSVSISVDLIAGEGLYKSQEDPVEAMNQDIAFVKSLCYPDYSKALVLPPPVVLLSLGSNFSMKGIVQSVDTSYKKPFDKQNRPMYVTLRFTVVQVSDNPPDYTDIRNRTSRSY